MSPDRGASAPERLPAILRRLKKAYPEARMALDFSSPLECVVATILSAQSTDAGVNKVTQSLFRKYQKPEDYLRVPEEELQRDIHATGFFRQKARSLRGMAAKLIEDYDGEVPPTMAQLTTLPGVARKTANIVQGNCFAKAARKDPDAGMAVDTHIGRVAVRLGLTRHPSKEAEKIESDLLQLIANKDRYRTTYLLIEHGRRVCVAKAPKCAQCPVEPLCPSSREAGLDDLYRSTVPPHAANKP